MLKDQEKDRLKNARQMMNGNEKPKKR